MLEDLICEKCYHDGAVYCATVESVADKESVAIIIGRHSARTC